jgi:hypothetical protein
MIEWAKLQDKRGEVAAAHMLLKRAMAVDPWSIYTYQCLGTLEFRQGHITEAREVFSKGLDMSETVRKDQPSTAKSRGVDACMYLCMCVKAYSLYSRGVHVKAGAVLLDFVLQVCSDF